MMENFVGLAALFSTEKQDLKEYLGKELIDKIAITGETTPEIYKKISDYFELREVEYNDYTELLEEEKKMVLYNTVYSIDQLKAQFYINSLRESLEVAFENTHGLFQNYCCHNGLIINKNSKTINHNFSIKDLTELFKDFDNIVYIPNETSNTSFFNILHDSFRNEIVFGISVDDIISQQNILEDFLLQLKIIFADPKNWSKLKILGLDPDGIGIALINSDFKTIEKYCNENTDPNIYKIAHNFLLLEIAEKLWTANEYNNYKSFYDVQLITLNGIEITKISDEGIKILSNNTPLYKAQFNDLEFTSDKKTILGREKVIASLFVGHGGGVSNQADAQREFDAINKHVIFTKAYGSGNYFMSNDKIPDILKDINQNNEYDTLITIIRQHGSSEYNSEHHGSIYNLPTSILDNQIYYLEECYSGIKINQINFKGKNIPVGKNLLYISSASDTEPLVVDDAIGATKKFDEFFKNRELTFNSFPEYVLKSVTQSTPHLSGYYHGQAVGPCKLSEFIADLNDPYSVYNQPGDVCNVFNYRIDTEVSGDICSEVTV